MEGNFSVKAAHTDSKWKTYKYKHLKTIRKIKNFYIKKMKEW